jgi:hypothetical protein
MRTVCVVLPMWAASQGLGIHGSEETLAEEGAEKVALQRRSVPQRLKPCCNHGFYGTGKPVPLSKTEFFISL